MIGGEAKQGSHALKLPQKVCQERYPWSSIVKADGPSGEALPAEGPAYAKGQGTRADCVT